MVQRELGLDGFCSRGPDEGVGVPVDGGDVAGNRAFEVMDRAKDASLETLASELGEEAFHGIEPGAGGRREVERPSRMFGEPRPAPEDVYGRHSCRGWRGSPCRPERTGRRLR